MAEIMQCPTCKTELRADVGYNRCPQCSNPLPGYDKPATPAQQSAQSNRPHKRKKNRMKEYKVLTQKDRIFGGKFDPEKLETAMNGYASQGWAVISIATASIQSITGNREEMIVVLERYK